MADFVFAFGSIEFRIRLLRDHYQLSVLHVDSFSIRLLSLFALVFFVKMIAKTLGTRSGDGDSSCLWDGTWRVTEDKEHVNHWDGYAQSSDLGSLSSSDVDFLERFDSFFR